MDSLHVLLNKRSMGLVLLVVLNHLPPHDTQLSFIPNGHVADMKYIVFLKDCASLFIFICFSPPATVFYVFKV